MDVINEMPTIRFSEIVDSFVNMHPSHRMKNFQETLMVYMREKYPSERNDRKRIKCFEIDYYEQIIKSPSDGEKEEQKKIKNIGRSIRRWLPFPKSKAKKDKLDYVQRASVIEAVFTLSGISVHETAKKIEDNGRVVAKKLLHAMGYPDLSASSEAEIFIIFALEKGLDFRTCQGYYGEYLKFKEKNNVEPDLREIGTTTHFYNYFDFSSKALDKERLFEKVAAKAHEFRAGSKKVSDEFVKAFEEKAKESSVLDTAALFYLMFSTKLEEGKIYLDTLESYKAHIREKHIISNVDYLSQWLCDNKYWHSIIPVTFDTFYSRLDDCKSKKMKAYISREGFIMWLLFCEKKFDEINAMIGGRLPTINLNSCFDRYATIIADFSYKGDCIIFYDRLKDTEYIVENDHKNNWSVPKGKNLSYLRASVASVLGKWFPPECSIPSLVATGMYVVTPKMFQTRTRKSDSKKEDHNV